MKKKLFIILTMVMLISSMPFPYGSAAIGLSDAFAATESYCESRASYGFYVVTATNLNVRKGPGMDYARCGTIPGGVVIHSTGAQKNGFIQIDTGKYHRNWISKSYLKSVWFERGSARVKTSGSNRLMLRSGPGTKFAVLSRLANGTLLGVTYRTDGWSFVRTGDGRCGWVSSSYLAMQSVSRR